MTLYELSRKDVIQTGTGENLGRVDDLVLEEDGARVSRVILRGRPRWFGLFGREEDLEIDWKDIRSIGADVIMVEVPQATARPPRPRRCRLG